MEGFAYFHSPDRIPVAAAKLRSWLNDGSIVMAEDILEGIDRTRQVMFSGGNLAKLIVKAG